MARTRLTAAPVAVVFLDAGGVLVLPDRRRVVDAYAAVGITVDADRVPRAHYVAGRVLDRFAKGDGDPAEYARAFSKALGVTAAEMERAIAAHVGLFSAPTAGVPLWSEPVPGTAAGLAALAHAGLAVVVVSNSDGNAAANLAAGGICQVGPGRGGPVTAVLDSALVGAAKPDPRIFAEALRRVAVPADAAVHVGDRITADIVGARAAGIQAVHFDPLRTCRLRDHTHTRSLTALAARVRAINTAATRSQLA